VSAHYGVKQVILMRTDLRTPQGQKVRSGKLMAQAAHASMIWLSKRVQSVFLMPFTLKAEDAEKYFFAAAAHFSAAEKEWLEGSFAKIVLAVDSEAELQRLVEAARADFLNAEVVTDAGMTEFGGIPTVTCAAIGPATSGAIDRITSHLRPL
jgi:peptidyl-tRNA hydrolase, PTH2 family